MTERTLQAPEGAFAARPEVPGDKSLSHRALLFAAMAAGSGEVTGLGPGADVAATAAALAHLAPRRGGITAWRPAPGMLDVANSGTTLRLLAGALAGRPFRSVLTGDESLRRRPMRRLVAPLAALGASVTTSPAGTAPVAVFAPQPLRGADHRIELASAQVRSAFALAALQADGPSRIEGPPGFRDHTERWLTAFGLGEWEDETAFRVNPGPVPPAAYPVPGDPSSAAFLWTAAALRSGAEVETAGVSVNPGRIGLLDVLEQFGADVSWEKTGDIHGDPIGTVRVRGAARGAAEVSGSLAVRALDELPLVAVLATAGDGLTTVSDASELRAKETDRIATTVAMVRALGGIAEATADGFVVHGTGGVRGGTIDAAGDHRIAMAAAVAATASREPVTVVGAEAAAVSWPGFYDALEELWSSR